jgi:glycosidase
MPTTLSDSTVADKLKKAKQGIPANGLTASPEDWRDCWIYFLMVDRFNNPVAPPPFPYNLDTQTFQGGTLAGMQAQLEYLKGLGVGAVWFTPVLRNGQFLQGAPNEGTYHGYGIENFLEIDPRFGSGAQDIEVELKAFVTAAHELGIYVIFDIVLNHTGDVFAYPGNQSTAPYQDHPYDIQWRDAEGNARADWTDALQITDPTDGAVLPSELRQNEFFRREGGGGPVETTGDFGSSKQMMSANYQLGTFLIQAYRYLIAAFDIDGFRIDTLKFLDQGFALRFGNAIREFALSVGKKNFFTFGEVWGSEDQIARFIGRNVFASSTDMVGVDAALDYPLFYALTTTLKGLSAPSSLAAMYQNRKNVENGVISSHGEAARFFVTFLDNHDQWNRFYYVDPSNPNHYDNQVTMAMAALLSLPGIPCIYYGTEQGLHGAGGSERATREALWGKPGTPFDDAHPFYMQLKKVSAVRSALPALRYGRIYFRPVSGDGATYGVSPYPNGVLAFARILNDSEVVVVTNTNTEETISISVVVDSTLSPAGTVLVSQYSNQSEAMEFATVTQTGEVHIHEVDGSTSGGPACVISVTVRPMEAIIFARQVA